MSNRQTVTVRGVDRIKDWPGLPTPVPGLAIVRDPDRGDCHIVHERSGTSPGAKRFSSPEAALAAAIEFGEVMDWTGSGHEIKALCNQGMNPLILNRIVRRYGGVSGTDRAGDEHLADLAGGDKS